MGARGISGQLLLALAVAAAADPGPWMHARGACSSCLRLRGGQGAFAPQQRMHPPQPQRSAVDMVKPEETKPVLKREQSRLVLEEHDDQEEEGGNATVADANATVSAEKKRTYLIDGEAVTEEQYNQRVKGVQHRAVDDWIAQSDTGGLREGDVIVPDHISSIPEAIAAVAYNQTVFIRRGYYTWDGVLVVQKHMHLRGEPNPDEGIPGGKGRPTLEGQWLLGENSSGSFKHVNCIARFDKSGRPEKHGPPPDLRTQPDN